MATPPLGEDNNAAEANSNKDKTQKVESGVYIGEGLPPVPIKLVQRIWRWDFVDMAEMLPELWTRGTDENPTKALATRVRHPVTNIKTWLKAFVTYVAIMAQKMG